MFCCNSIKIKSEVESERLKKEREREKKTANCGYRERNLHILNYNKFNSDDRFSNEDYKPFALQGKPEIKR